MQKKIKKLKSISDIKKEYKIVYDAISDTIDAYIVDTFGDEYLDLIRGIFWSDPSKNTLTKKPEFLKIIEEQWEQFYPDNLGGFDNMADLGKKLNINKLDTIYKWMQEFFIEKYDEMDLSKSEAISLYKKYTKIKQITITYRKGSKEIQRKLITWDRIEKRVVDKGWKIDYSKMNEKKFNSIKSKKGNIKIPLICDAKEQPHHFKQSVEDILYSDHQCPHCFKDYSERLKKVGKNADPSLSLSTLCFFLDNYVTALSEVPSNPSTSERKGTKHRVEVFLPNKLEFGKLIKDKLLLDEKIPECIDEIAIDFTFHFHPWILDKLFKHYQKSNRFLIIVVYGTVSNQELKDINRNIQEDPRYDYPEHVKVVSLQQFAEFFGMDTYKQGFYHKKLESTELLAESAITSDSDYNDLAAKYNKIYPILKKARETGDYGSLFDALGTIDRFIGKKP